MHIGTISAVQSIHTYTNSNGIISQASFAHSHPSFLRMTKQSVYFYGNHFCCIRVSLCVWCSEKLMVTSDAVFLTPLCWQMCVRTLITSLCPYHCVCVCVCHVGCVAAEMSVVVMWCCGDAGQVFLWRKGDQLPLIGCVPSWNKTISTETAFFYAMN